MKIFLRRNPASLNTDVFFIDGMDSDFRHAGDVFCYYTFTEHGEAIGHNVNYEPGKITEMRPAFTLPEPTVRDMIMAFADLGREEGLPNHNESYISGRLESTERHLSDMRQLVFGEKEKPKA